jgi:IS30 family transposase
MKKGKHLTQKEFDQLKALVMTGVSVSKLSEVTGRSRSTLQKIKECETLRGYKELTQRYLDRSNENKAKKETTPTKEVVSKFVPEIPDTTLALLERIAIALEKMEVHWRAKAQTIEGLG